MTRILRRRTSGLAVAIALSALACSSGKKAAEQPPPFTWEGPGTGTVGAGGGAVALTEGPHLAVPAGALAADTAITITRSTPGPLPGGLTPVFQFEPAGTAFAAPATVTFAVPAGTSAALLLWSAPGSTGYFEKIPVRIRGTTASAEVGHFSSGYVTSAAGSDPPPAGSCPPPGSDPCAVGHWETWWGSSSSFCVYDEHAPDGTGCWPLPPVACVPPFCGPKGGRVAQVGNPGTWQGSARSPWDGHCLAGECAPPRYYELHGAITGEAPAAVSIAVDGCGRGEAIASLGGYALVGLVSCTYTVAASAPGYTFDPPSRFITVLGTDVTGVDFRGIRDTYEVSGTVRGAVTGGVGVALGGDASASAVTAPDGQYHFYGLGNGSYTLTPSLAGYAFAPESRSVQVSGHPVTGQDFTATTIGHALSGTVGGALAAGVTVALTGASIATAVTDAQGRYAFGSLADGRYTVTPSQLGYTFAPESRTADLAGVDLGGQDFTAAPVPGTHRLAGGVTGAVRAGVTIALTGAASASAVTDAAGLFEFLVADGNYTVTPSRAGYRFDPPWRLAGVAGLDVSLAAFVASRTGAWESVASGTSLGLYAIGGRGPSDAWAAGDQGTVLRWEGGSWAAMSSGTSQPLFAVWAAPPPPGLPDAGPWAVGPWLGGAGNALLYWDAAGTPPLWRSGFTDPDFVNVTFQGIWGDGAHDIWAVGWSIFRTGPAALWQRVLHPLPGTVWLSAVWGSGAADVWAVGAEVSSQAGRVLHWDGTEWALASPPACPALYAVWGSGPADVWAAGEGPTLLHWDGSAWTDRSADLPVVCEPTRRCRLHALWGSDPADAWAVGYVDLADPDAPEKGGVAFHWDGSAWQRSPILAPAPLRGVWGSGPGDPVWAVGEGGAILRWVP